jgi:hypothetical protein
MLLAKPKHYWKMGVLVTAVAGQSLSRYKTVLGNPEGNRPIPLGKPRRMCKDNIITNLI